jgi:uncharacterized protein
MTTSRTIYVDMDDVLCETARFFLTIIESRFRKSLAYEHLIHFDLGKACGLLPEQCEELYRIAHLPDELLKIEPIHAALVALRHWSESGYQIAIVTGRPPATAAASLEWLARHRVPYHSFTIVDKYARFTTDDTVAISLAELASQDFCWAIEDSLPMARYLAETMEVRVALLDRPWNRSAADHPKLKRCKDWREIVQDFDATQ